MRRLLLTLAVIGLGCCQSAPGPSCANYYDESSLPQECVNYTCKFSAITNSSLIVDPPQPNQTYVVCLDLPNHNVTIGGDSDNLESSLYISANSITIGPAYIFITTYDIILIASQSITITNTNITAALVWLQADTISLTKTQILNEEYFPTECNCLNKGVVCPLNQFYFPYLYNDPNSPSNFTMQLVNVTYQNWKFLGDGVNSAVLTANTSLSLQDSLLRISVIAMYSESISMQKSLLNVSGLGFPSGTGYGCGYFDEVLNQLLACTGTGGSHGGYGGNSWPDSCNLLMSNPPYGKQTIPKYPGSGGGFFLKQITEVSSGGGVVMIQVYNLSISVSQIHSDGFAGIQGGGGGSGGSISLDYFQAEPSGNNVVTANGGNGDSSGGGGRMRVWNHNWRYPAPTEALGSVLYQVLGGTACQTAHNTLACGQSGSIVTTPCPPGYQLNFVSLICEPCPVGTYQLSYGYSRCLDCQNKPPNSIYTAINSSTTLSNFLQVCSFVCADNSFKSYRGRQCLSKLEYMLADVGGINILICLGMVLGTLLVLLVVVMVRKLSESGQSQFPDNQHLDSSQKRSYFKIEDIPYHELRIYFEGDNTPAHPWHISTALDQQIRSKYEHDPKMSQLMPRLLRELNLICQYSRALRLTLFCLKLTYYPFGLLLASLFRDSKVKQIRKAIMLKFKNVQSHVTVKLHVNDQCSVGCLEIFNSKKETLDFYIKNYFPLFFKLETLALGGHAIDLADPLLRALSSEFQQHNERKLQDFLLELNHLLHNSEQTLPIYKHLWKISEHEPSLQCYLWQPQRGVLGIDDNNIQIVKELDLFLLFSTDDKTNNPAPSNHLMSDSRLEDPSERHFLYRHELNNVYLDEITCIRHRYNLRELLAENEEGRTVFWQIDNNLREKYITWTLGTVNILTFLLNFLTVPLIIFLLVVDEDRKFVLAFIPYFALFPLCQFFHVYAEFSLVLAKGPRIMTYAIYFAVFIVGKYVVLNVVMLVVVLTNNYTDLIMQALLYIFLALLLLNSIALVLLCMLHVHLSKPK